MRPLCQPFPSTQTRYKSSRLPSIPKLVANQRAATQRNAPYGIAGRPEMAPSAPFDSVVGLAMQTTVKTFEEWIARYKDVESPRGDLAVNIAIDDRWPIGEGIER